MSRFFNKSILAATATAAISILISVIFILLFLSSSSSTTIHAAQPPSAWRGRRIYQLLTDRFAYANNANSSSHCGPNGTGTCNMNLYNGGTFQGIIDHLDYIANMGFDAIWISPIPRQYEGKYEGQYEAYHGYWQIDVTNNFSNVNPHYGTPQDLQNLIQACHAKNIWVMADFVLNHAGPIGTDYSLVTPLNESQYYHPDCAVNVYQCENTNTLDCRLAGLADFDQSNSFVSQTLLNYVKYLIDVGFDGLRLDTTMYVPNSFVKQATETSGTLVTGEVWSTWSCMENYISDGVTSTLNYQLFDVLRSVFLQKQSMRQLGTQWRQVKALPLGYLMTNFVDNHDNTRWLSMSGATTANFISAVGYSLFQMGIPIVYQGTEQFYKGEISDNTNRYPIWTSEFNQNSQMYLWLKNANNAFSEFSLNAIDTEELWQDDSMYCFARGPVLFCAANTEGTAQTRTIPNLPFKSGDTVCNWFNSQTECLSGASTMQITVGSDSMPILLYAKRN